MNNIDINNFHEIDVKIEYQQILDEFGGKCVNVLKNNSPKGHRGRYAQGWVSTEDTDYLGNYSVTVWNETDWQLTHLLENGHLIVNKKGGAGWASPKPHIKKSYRAIKTPFENAMKKVNLQITAK